ncbi:MAG: hypothetical protein IJL30_07260 [Clostridia bacterium]|nr:hypothetical protein [Clostridia bacterium]
MENRKHSIRQSSFTETRDLIVSQGHNGHLSVIDKATGAMMVHMAYIKPLTREQLEFIASDCQSCYTVRQSV